MPHTVTLSAVLLSVASLLITADALADDPATSAEAEEEELDLDRPVDWRDHRVFVGGYVGIAWPTVEHPEVVPSASFTAAMIGLHAGYQVLESLSLGVEISGFEKAMRRRSGGELFKPGSTLEPQAACLDCEAPLAGGYLLAISAVFTTVGPRIEYTPFGRDGLYLGAFGGVASVTGLPTPIGVGGAARAGFRLRVAEIITFAAEGGIQAQSFEGASTMAPYAAVMLRPYL